MENQVKELLVEESFSGEGNADEGVDTAKGEKEGEGEDKNDDCGDEDGDVFSCLLNAVNQLVPKDEEDASC